MPKKPLPARLEPDLITRLNRVSTTRKISVNDVISLALDGLEGEREVAQTITDRIEFMEKNLAALAELVEVFTQNMGRHFNEVGQCFSEAGAVEKERLGALYRLLEGRLKDHDEAERERFRNLILSEGSRL